MQQLPESLDLNNDYINDYKEIFFSAVFFFFFSLCRFMVMSGLS